MSLEKYDEVDSVKVLSDVATLWMQGKIEKADLYETRDRILKEKNTLANSARSHLGQTIIKNEIKEAEATKEEEEDEATVEIDPGRLVPQPRFRERSNASDASAGQPSDRTWPPSPYEIPPGHAAGQPSDPTWPPSDDEVTTPGTVPKDEVTNPGFAQEVQPPQGDPGSPCPITPQRNVVVFSEIPTLDDEFPDSGFMGLFTAGDSLA